MKSNSKGEKENPTVKHNRMNINIDLGTGNQQIESKHKELESKHEQLEFKHKQLESKHKQLLSQEKGTACHQKRVAENFVHCGLNEDGDTCVCESGPDPIPMQTDGADECFCNRDETKGFMVVDTEK